MQQYTHTIYGEVSYRADTHHNSRGTGNLLGACYMPTPHALTASMPQAVLSAAAVTASCRQPLLMHAAMLASFMLVKLVKQII